MLSPPKPLDKIQPNLVFELYSHEWGVQQQIFLISITKSISNQRLLYQTLFLFSQMKDTKHIRRDFNSVAWVMPQGSDFGALGVPRGGQKINFSNMVMWHIKSTGMTRRTKC